MWVAVHLLGSIWIPDMSLWNPIQAVSGCAPSGLHLNPWYVFMKSHLGCEWLCTSWASFESLTCLYEISSRMWVAVHLLGFIWIPDMFLWNSIQDVSGCASPRLHLNPWNVFMKFHPACEWLCIFWAPFESLTCLYEIPSRLWVAVHLLGFIWIPDMSLWNPIQHVSGCASSGLHLNHWHVFMKSHPACEWLCISWAPFESLTCLYEIPSSVWVAVHLLGSIWIPDIFSWNPIQHVSGCAPPGLHLNPWHFMKSHPACEWLCTSWAPFESLTYFHEIPSSVWVAVHLLGSIWLPDTLWNPIQYVSGCAPPGLYLNHWHVFMKSHPACKWLCTSQAPFESLTCFYEIPSSLWVAVHLLGSIWIPDMFLWNLIQHVSGCAPPGLHLNPWHFMKSHPVCEWLCTSWAPFEILTCLHKISSRMWVIVCLLGSIWITDIFLFLLV